MNKIMKAVATAALSATIALIALIVLPLGEASAQERQLMTPTAPQFQQRQISPRIVRPGSQGAVTPGGQVATRTHCNGTCACTGDDCNSTWQDNNCVKDSYTCSTGSGAGVVCSCINKAKK